jgi:hypothetical protein
MGKQVTKPFYLQNRWNFLNFASGFFVVLTLILIPYVVIGSWNFSESLSQNLIFGRTQSLFGLFQGIGGNQLGIMLVIFGTALALTFILTKGKSIEQLFFSKQGFFLIALTMLFLPAWHEFEWFIADILTFGPLSLYFSASYAAGSWRWLITSTVLLGIYFYFHKFHKKELIFILASSAYYFVWVYFFGFQNTAILSNAYNLSLFTHELELFSWILPCALWIILHLRISPQIVLRLSPALSKLAVRSQDKLASQKRMLRRTLLRARRTYSKLFYRRKLNPFTDRK